MCSRSFIVAELITWGRKMGKRLESLRRSESRDSLDSLSSRDSVSTTCRQPSSWTPGEQQTDCKSSTLKGFFTRIGSTGMLSYSRLYSNSFREKLQQHRKPAECQLYRSVSTSHLAHPSYMKGDDPADCLDRGGSCGSESRMIGQGDGSGGVSIGGGAEIECPTEPGYVPLKTRSCDNISKLGASKKPNFPYAFLRSRLSVLPEENGGSVISHLARASVKQRCAPTLQQHQQQQPLQQQHQHHQHHHHQHGAEHEIVVTEELFKEMDNECRNEYRRVFSNLSSSNESGYDSDGPRTSADHHHPYRPARTADEDSGFGDTKSLAADSLNEFEESTASSESSGGPSASSVPPPPPRRSCGGGDKDYNVPSMSLFYKKNREINDRIRSADEKRPPSKETPNFHRRMFVKNRSSPSGVDQHHHYQLHQSHQQLSSLPVDLDSLRSRMQMVRLLKTRYEDDIGVYLKMAVMRVAEYSETRFVVVKLEPGKIADRYGLFEFFFFFCSKRLLKFSKYIHRNDTRVLNFKHLRVLLRFAFLHRTACMYARLIKTRPVTSNTTTGSSFIVMTFVVRYSCCSLGIGVFNH